MKKSALLKAKTLGDWAYLAIEKHFHQILKHEDDVLKDRKPEALHQMRVGMRRLRSSVTGFALALELPKNGTEKNIGKVAHRLGELRDLDVLKEALQTYYKPELPKLEQKSLEALTEYVDKQRKRTLRKVRSPKATQQYQDLKQSFQEWLQQPKYGEFSQFPISNILPDLLLPSVSELLLHPGFLVNISVKDSESDGQQLNNPVMVEQLVSVHGPVLHSLRKQIKRVRYQMELFTNFYGKDYSDRLDNLSEIQSVLGQVQDNVVLTEFITDVLESEISTELPTLAKSLEQSTYQAWQQWQPLQQQFLNSQIRQAFHLAVIQPTDAVKSQN